MTETTKTYMNHAIEVRPDFRFQVSGPEFGDDNRRLHERLFDSYAGATAEIERRVEASAKADLGNIRLNLVLLNEAGEPIQVTRINRMTGRLNGFNDLNKQAYPNVAWVREALVRVNRLRNEVREIDKRLAELQLPVDRSSWGGRIEAAEYAHRVKQLESQVAEATQKAREMQEPSEVAKGEVEASA